MDIDSSVASKLREWTAAGRGWTCWRNQEIGGSAAQEVFTPRLAENGSDMGAPDWRYAKAFDDRATEPMVEMRRGKTLASWKAQGKLYYWGPWITKASEAKAKRIAAKHNADWSWHYDDDSKPIVEVAKVERVAFA